jgi:hypothetical protein
MARVDNNEGLMSPDFGAAELQGLPGMNRTHSNEETPFTQNSKDDITKECAMCGRTWNPRHTGIDKHFCPMCLPEPYRSVSILLFGLAAHSKSKTYTFLRFT